jgi:hypothetical protein
MRILSLGAGVQSSTLALMIARGDLPMVDCAIFADTGAELYLHRSLKPLKDVQLTAEERGQPDLFNNECEGLCGM